MPATAPLHVPGLHCPQHQGGEIITAKLQSRHPGGLRSECPPKIQMTLEQCRGQGYPPHHRLPHSWISTYNMCLPQSLTSPLVSCRNLDPGLPVDTQILRCSVPHIKWCRTLHPISPPHMQIPNCRWKMLSLIYSWWIRRADWIFIEKYPHVSEAVQFKWVLLKGQLYFCRWHRPGSESVGLAWPPDAIAMTQGKPGFWKGLR